MYRYRYEQVSDSIAFHRQVPGAESRKAHVVKNSMCQYQSDSDISLLVRAESKSSKNWRETKCKDIARHPVCMASWQASDIRIRLFEFSSMRLRQRLTALGADINLGTSATENRTKIT